MTARTTTIDLTPSWGDFGLLYARLAESGEREALARLRPDLAKAAAAAQALLELGDSLTQEQSKQRDAIMRRELAKQLPGLTPDTFSADKLEA